MILILSVVGELASLYVPDKTKGTTPFVALPGIPGRARPVER